MRLRKSYKVRQKGRNKTYDYVTCPDTESERGNTTKLIHQCKPCDSYHGILDDISGLYVRCGFFKPRDALDINREVFIEDTRFYVNKRLMWSLKYFGIQPAEFEYGLSHVKRKAKSEFRKRIRDFHPDTTDLEDKRANRELRKLMNMYARIDRLKLTPPTDDTINAHLDLEKGYKTMDDCEV